MNNNEVLNRFKSIKWHRVLAVYAALLSTLLFLAIMADEGRAMKLGERYKGIRDDINEAIGGRDQPYNNLLNANLKTAERLYGEISGLLDDVENGATVLVDPWGFIRLWYGEDKPLTLLKTALDVLSERINELRGVTHKADLIYPMNPLYMQLRCNMQGNVWVCNLYSRGENECTAFEVGSDPPADPTVGESQVGHFQCAKLGTN